MILIGRAFGTNLSDKRDRCLSCFEYDLIHSKFCFFLSILTQSTEAVFEKEKQISVTVSLNFGFNTIVVFVDDLLRLYLIGNCGKIGQWPKQLNAPLEEVDPEIADIIEHEKARQWKVHHFLC